MIVGVTDETISDWIENREFLLMDNNEEYDAYNIASHIGLIHTLKEYNLKRVITFHNRVKSAKNFSNDHVNFHNG